MFIEGIICIEGIGAAAGIILQSILLVKDGTAQVLGGTKKF